MSIALMSVIWNDADVSGSDLLVLLALADHANDDGLCWPSIPRLAQRARISERQCKRVIGRLENAGWISIVKRGDGRGHSTLYKLNEKGDRMSPFSTTKGDIQGRKGDIQGQKGVTHDTRSVIEPSIKEDDRADTVLAAIYLRYEAAFGIVSQDVGERLAFARDNHAPEDVLRAITRAHENNARSPIRYIETILRNGIDTPNPPANRYPTRAERNQQVFDSMRRRINELGQHDGAADDVRSIPDRRGDRGPARKLPAPPGVIDA